MKKRVIALDTETTGFRTNAAILSFYAVEFDMETGICGKALELNFNPGFPIDAKITEITGITNEMAKAHPLMSEEHAQQIADFLKDAEVWIHNQSFDERIISYHLARFNQKPLRQIANLHCSLRVAKDNNHIKATLNDICMHFDIDLSGRSKHGAKVDTLLLIEVVVKMKSSGYRGFTETSPSIHQISQTKSPKSEYPVEAKCQKCDEPFQKKGAWQLKCFPCWKAANNSKDLLQFAK